MRFSVFPTAATRGIFGIRTVGPQTVASLSQLFPSASAFLHFSVYSARIGLLAQAAGKSPSNTRKTRIDDFFSFH